MCSSSFQTQLVILRRIAYYVCAVYVQFYKLQHFNLHVYKIMVKWKCGAETTINMFVNLPIHHCAACKDLIVVTAGNRSSIL